MKCPECDHNVIKRDTEDGTEILGADITVVVAREDLETDYPREFIYCDNCDADLMLNKYGELVLVPDEYKERFCLANIT